MRWPRSIIVYAWFGLALQLVLVAGVAVLVLVGGAYQRSAVASLSRAHATQLSNLRLSADFLGAERAARGYQATRQPRFHYSFDAERERFDVSLRRLRSLARPAVVGGVVSEGATAQAAFAAAAAAMSSRPGSQDASRHYAQVSDLSDRFLAENGSLRQKLVAEARTLTGESQRTLGIGIGWTSLILAIVAASPVAAALAWLWASRPLHNVTTTIRRRAAGDYQARAVPGGPADVRDLALSLNFLADESDRMRVAQAERTRLLAQARDAAMRIRAHLSSRDVIREAVVALAEQVPADGVAATLIAGQHVRIAEAAPAAVADFVHGIPELSRSTAEWMRAMHRNRVSFCVQDLNGPGGERVPGPVLSGLREVGAVSVLVVPFGESREALGLIGLMRRDLGKPWTPAEIEAVESLAIDIGRGLEHARLYEAEQRLVADLESLDQAKVSFLASASHDLRTPLTSITGYVELIQDGDAGPVTAEQARMLDAVARNTRRLRNMIEDMLTISKIELGSFQSELHPVDLAELVSSAVEMIRPSARESGLGFRVSSPRRGLVVDGDAEQLDRMLMNLLSNAVKYTPAGGSVALTAERDDGRAVLRVADTGIGIPEEEQHALFTRFFRASNAVNRAIQGSGLGLSIVQAIVGNHHGDIGVESRPDVGTTVTVRIPLREDGKVEGDAG